MCPMEAIDVGLRPLRATDAPDLHRTCFPDQPTQAVRDHLDWCLTEQEKGRLVCLVAAANEGAAVADSQVVAIGQLAVLHGNGEIGSLVVAPNFRRQGIGTALVRALVERARQRRLQAVEITADVERPWIRAWYERLGFVYRRKHDFPDQRVAVLTMDLTQGDPQCPLPHASP
jgi:ribosomal protein S18 acetylase RimI-like enzyme